MSELGLSKLRGVIRRRRLPVVATMAGVLGIAAITIWQLEPGYKASAVIRVAEAQPAKEYVAPTVAEQIGDRLKSLRLSVMSRPVVAEAAKELDLYKHWPRKSQEEVVDEMKSRMDVKVEGDDTFLLTYTDSTPERARAVVNKVSEVFMKRQIEQRQKMASATTQALRTEVDALKPQMDAAEKKIREFKLAHYGTLPEQQEGNLRTLDQTTMQLNIASTNLDMDQERRRALLASAMSTLRHHEETLAAELYEARTKYTPDHPEVKRIASEYENVKKARIADEADLRGKTRKNNPELTALEGEIARSKAIIAGLRQRESEVRARVEGTAKTGQELALLTADYDSLRGKYNSAYTRMRDAELAEGLEKGLASVRYDLVEGASLPAHATAPNRPLLAVGAIILALALGLGIGFALDMQDTSIRDPEQLRAVAQSTPILACIPHVGAPKGAGLTNPIGPKAEA